ncbi:MAG: DNA-3-methyladenine glycosylase I [Devosiaceae bacterium]|nr:DNA-3-methyladenine glycosylase I [Devosiaceae bacterium]
MNDTTTRCTWPGETELYVAYHDEEWGVPIYEDQPLFEKLILDGFQAGLSWITILRKRDRFIEVFEGFDPEKIVRFTPEKIETLMQDTGIVRNRLKIEGTVKNARGYLAIQEDMGFSNYLWGFLDGEPLQNNFATFSDIPAQTELSQRISKDLKSRGFTFVGPTIVYAFMQAVGMINDHTTDCFRHKECVALARKPKP